MKRWEVRIGKEAMEGEDETSSVDIDDLVAGGESKIKEWIKFMSEKKKGGIEGEVKADIATPMEDFGEKPEEETVPSEVPSEEPKEEPTEEPPAEDTPAPDADE